MTTVRLQAKDAPLRALDYAVLIIEGKTDRLSQVSRRPRQFGLPQPNYLALQHGGDFVPTERWDQAGHLLEKHWVELTRWLRINVGPDWESKAAGANLLPTLIRALVASVLVEFSVPECLQLHLEPASQ